MTKLTMQNGDVVYLDCDVKYAKYLVDSAGTGHMVTTLGYKEKEKQNKVYINLMAVVTFEEA